MRRAVVPLFVLALLALPALPTVGFPVASDEASYALCGRVFPDPHAYWPAPAPAPGQSPWAKGNGECRATDFLGWDETLAGLTFLADDLFPDFVEVYDLSDTDGEFADILDQANGEGLTAGLPAEDLGRERVPMYLVRVTDEEHTAPIDDREHFVYALSIHGIERAGVEGGIRAIEDLATWASCEKHGDDSAANCAQEGQIPHPLMETLPEESVTAGEALKQSSVWFVLSNPDGWRRGDKQDGGFFYQRYNGNGVDMNRDWPTQGFTFRPYTPWSEPETRAVGKVLKDIKPEWSGGIDLHGQLIDRAFSFTLIGGSERPFDKDRRVLQFVKGAWADAEAKLSWNPIIKPNDAPEDDERLYGVQWGTIWDTIAYTVTGAHGDWIDSPLGLNADGIDNEMSLSHLSNCGVGSCFLTDFEQLHVDGNKSLIYAMINYTLLPEDTEFRYEGRAGYLYHDGRVSHPGSTTSTDPAWLSLPQQDGFEVPIDHAGGVSTHDFEVLGPDDGVYNGALQATITWSNATGIGGGSLDEIALERYRTGEEDPNRDEGWEAVNTYYNQAPTYAQGGARLDGNMPLPGQYRIRIEGAVASRFNADVQFLGAQAWPDPGQLPYDVSNLDFVDDLRPFVPYTGPVADQAPGGPAWIQPPILQPVPVDAVLARTVDLAQFDSLVVADDTLLPGFVDPDTALPDAPTQDPIEDSFLCDCAPGAGERSDATSGFYEFDVDPGQAQLEAEVSSDTVVDPDLYLQRQNDDGTWSEDVTAGETGRTGYETLTLSRPAAGHYRLEVHNWAGAPGPVDVTVTFGGDEDDSSIETPTPYTTADRDTLAAALKGFATSGGNLVLTDDGLRALSWMGLVPTEAVTSRAVYAGHIEFSDDGGSTATYDDPLAANVDQPGAAEGSNHRHQVTEPVPLGYAIQDGSGGDLDSMPQWAVDRDAFDDTGGRVVGTLGGEDVTFGEIELGDGVVRLVGSLLTVPTDQYDHPFGLGAYGLTYTGYEVLRNTLDWLNPNGTTAPSGVIRLFGDTRYTTAIDISKDGFPGGSAESVVLARGDLFPDGLAGTPLAVRRHAPILLSPSDHLLDEVADEIQRVLPAGRTVYLLGGEAALAAEVEQAVLDLGYKIKRVWGKTRYETAIAIAEELGNPDTLLITTGQDFPDALAAAAAGAHVGGAVLLTTSEVPHPSLDAYLAEHGAATQQYGIGGPAARAYPDAEPVFGRLREHTALAVADTFFDQPAAVGVARRDEFPDSLTGGAHIGRKGGPLLITPKDRLHEDVAAWVCRADAPSLGWIYGGVAAVSAQVEADLRARMFGVGC